MTQQGCLIIADITGYSKYVNESELEHARDSLADLLNLLIKHTQSPLVLSKLEGDAVFSYAPAGGFIQGQSLLDMIESTYASFRKALELMVLNTTCACNACRNLPNLDLKFFVHFGSFMTQKLGTLTELVGNDVNLVHRLAKNRIKEETGFKAYAAFTQSVMDALGLEEFQKSLTPHREAFADVGEVQMYVGDLHEVWDRLKETVRIEVGREAALLVREQTFPVPPSILWDYLTKPEYRTLILGASEMNLRNRANGRIAVESVYYCYHGKMQSQHTIVDWQPFERFTINGTTPIKVNFDTTYLLEPTEEGTRLVSLWGKARGPWILCRVSNLLQKLVFVGQTDKAMDQLRDLIRKDLAEGTAFVAPTIQLDTAQIVSLATQTLTRTDAP